MDVILVPGLWLTASSWDAVLPTLVAAGHRPHPLTLPDDPGARIDDWVDAVVRQIDALDSPVVLGGHSGGGNVVWGAADRRPERVARVVFVDTMPTPPGGMISTFPVVDGVVPFPGWEFFDEPDVADLDEATRERTASDTVAVPAQVPTDRLTLADARRYGIPVTILSGRLDTESLPAVLAEWGEWAEEFERIRETEVVHLNSGHWPQFSQPAAFGEHLRRSVR